MRHRQGDRFTVVGNHLSQHPDLSATAIGVAVYIQSLPDGASVTAKALTSRFREGETTIRRALNELEAAGYLERQVVRLDNGRLATRTLFYDKPGCGQLQAPEAPQRQQPTRPTPVTGGEGDIRPRPATGPMESPPPPPVALKEPPDPPPAADTTCGVLGPRQPASAAPRPAACVTPATPAWSPAMGVLAGLRAVDPRLLLSERDMEHLAAAVEEWLDRGVPPAQITRAVTESLPRDHIRWPARFLAHRLTTLLPPPLPAGPQPYDLAPLETCDGCERAFRTRTAGEMCADCRRPGPSGEAP